jgi:hypothetical protein
VQNLSSSLQDLTVIEQSVVLITKMTNKYSYSMRSDPLYEEIIYVCDTVHDAFLVLTANLVQSLQDPVQCGI